MRFYDNLIGHDLNDPNLKLNKRGHRCKDIEEINFHNYILFAGDNVSLDFNSEIEDTYPHLISQQLKADYYNLSIFNGGIDVIKYNLLTWYYKFPAPKFIVISTEFLNAFVVSDKSLSTISLPDYSTQEVQQILRVGETSGFFPSRRLFTQNIILNHIHIPIYQIKFKDKASLFDDGVINLVHDGDVFDHVAMAKLVTNKVQNNRRVILP